MRTLTGKSKVRLAIMVDGGECGSAFLAEMPMVVCFLQGGSGKGKVWYIPEGQYILEYIERLA